MFKIILHHLTCWFEKTDVIEENDTERVDRLYTKGLVLLYRASTLSQLQIARLVIKKHEDEIIKHKNLPWMVEQQDKLNKLWIQKYKLWKHKD